ncbi:uncharacterized protein LOC135396202 [Ornithodoros turicata]|uniref:uncharacterized protein LOC135396202 n=1 Tax=Ornithodoros turicata TaxID=34597 RepID=UPI003139676A
MYNVAPEVVAEEEALPDDLVTADRKAIDDQPGDAAPKPPASSSTNMMFMSVVVLAIICSAAVGFAIYQRQNTTLAPEATTPATPTTPNATTTVNATTVHNITTPANKTMFDSQVIENLPEDE